MLHLTSETSDAWLSAASSQLELLLLDHAHCEKKAASTAMNLIFRYGNDEGLMRPLSELAREELEHFELLLTLLRERGIPFRKLEASPYGARLHTAVRRPEPERLLDTLLACALIEARSCERMKRLANGLPDAELRAFYGSLLASEARHFQLYIDLATERFGREPTRARLAELAAHEATTLDDPDAPLRMHS